MDKTLFQELPMRERIQALSDNCASEEEKYFMREFTPEELAQYKEELANVAIDIAAIEEEWQAAKDSMKLRLKPLREQHAEMLGNIKRMQREVKETCYRFTDPETRETGYYNANGELIEQRQATANELQPVLFKPTRVPYEPTGTEN
ncbi:MAG: hypothetical protein LIP09_00720 [Bacteroidales bacterium]|nr:hypothetical protein [Bacteroidales bacterium]